MSKLRRFTYKNRKGCIEIFGSAQEVVNVAMERKNTDSNFHDYQNGYEVDKSWCGVESYEEALEMMRTGYQPTVEKMKEVLKANLSGQSKRISFRNEVVGFQPVVPLMLQGIPTCMVNTYIKPIKTKVINICYDSTASWNTSVDDMIKAGQKMLGALIELEMQGYRFNLYATQTYNNDKESYILCTKVKSANTALDLKRISFPLTHPAFFRVIGFDWYGRCPMAKYISAYGKALRYIMDNDKASEMMSTIMGEKVVYFSATGILKQGKDDIKEVITNEKV